MLKNIRIADDMKVLGVTSEHMKGGIIMSKNLMMRVNGKVAVATVAAAMVLFTSAMCPINVWAEEVYDEDPAGDETLAENPEGEETPGENPFGDDRRSKSAPAFLCVGGLALYVYIMVL